MPIVKPPVSSSIEIEIKTPEGVSIDGDTKIFPKVKKDVNNIYKVSIVIGQEILEDTIEITIGNLLSMVKKWGVEGYIFEHPSNYTASFSDKYIYYPPYKIDKVIIEKL